VPVKGERGRAAAVACVAAAVVVGQGGAVLAQGGAAPVASIVDGVVQVAQAGFAGGTVQEIRVEGTQRIDPATVRAYVTLMPGDPFDPVRIDDSLRALFGTGLFADVTLRRVGDALVVQVVENPIINRIAFEGNQRLDDDELRAEAQLRPRVVLTRTRVESDVQRILELYRRSGRFAATVEPKIIQLDQNRVDLVFEIDEGPLTGVRGISFIGNQEFSDARLRREIQTRESAWWRFLTTADNYDPDRLTFDRELLRRFYLSRGYADFRVVSAVAELAPDRGGFFITFTVDEGPRYRFGEVGVRTALATIPSEELEGLLTTREGDWYDASAVERSVTALSNALADRQFAFVDVRPRIERDRETRTVSITYDIEEGPRVFVERIDIVGNFRTTDEVIRRQFLLAEGDPFSASALRRSEQRVRDLGFFERVEVRRGEGVQGDTTVLEVEVAERATGEVSFGVGFSTADGPLADVGIRERNLLGRGQDLRFGFTVSGRGTQADVSFTEPYFLDRDLSAGFDIYRRTRDNRDESSFDERNVGFALRLGYPIAEFLRQRLFYSLTQTTIENVPTTASRFIREQQGERLVSLVGQELVYDRRDSRLDPTEGYVLRLTSEIAGLGGDAQFVRGRLGGAYYIPVAENWIFSVSGEAGQVIGLGDDVAISDRFFLGGDNLRGFARAGVGPRDLTRGLDDSLGGNTFYRGSVEMQFPIGLPEELGVRGRVFSDFGSLWNADATPRPGEDFRDESSLRASAGVGISWSSPLGPIRVDLARAFLREDYDETEVFRFSFGTRF
jgi:outer membrane protein insertion porin family